MGKFGGLVAVIGAMLLANGPAPVAAAPVPWDPPVVCDGDGVSGNRVQVVYLYRGENRLPTFESYLRATAVEVDRYFNDSAHKTGGERHVRYVHDAACHINIVEQAIPAGITDWGNYLWNEGFNRLDRVYLVLADNVDEELCGVAFDRVAAFAPSCFKAPVATHELTHQFGGVKGQQADGTRPPNSTDNGHCWDMQDLLCYDDDKNESTFPLQMVCPQGWGLLDCNNDDYYHTDPAPGSYLATHPWLNAANSAFLIKNTYQTTGGPIPGHIYNLHSNGTSPGTKWNGITPAWGSGDPGAAVELADAPSGGIHGWRLVPGDSWNWRLINAGTDKCLTLTGTTPGSVATQEYCGTTGGQLWTFTHLNHGRYILQTAFGGLVLTVDGLLNVSGAAVVGQYYNNSPAQQWLFTLIG
jgi:Ricin-type beta-trefoil lectin domain-like